MTVRSGRGQGRPWYQRFWGVIGIAVGSLFLLGGIGDAMAGSGDPEGGKAEPASGDDARHSDRTPDDPDEAASEEEATATPAAKPKTGPKPETKPKPTTYLVVDVVDGDTIELGNGQTVRVVGIDTPERGECGYEKASDNLARLVLGKRVRLADSDEDTDRYGRLLRYVDVGSVDAGLAQIKQGFAIARYDSRDGYGFHPREPI